MRESYKRLIKGSKEDLEMNLPEGKYCKDCFHFQTGRCKNIYGRIDMDEVCDWFPCRFAEPVQRVLVDDVK